MRGRFRIGALDSLFIRVIKTAGVRAVTFHAMRHASASLMLADGTPVNVVAQRLGHATPMETLTTYSHVMPNAQKDAALRLGNLLHGR